MAGTRDIEISAHGWNCIKLRQNCVQKIN